MLKGKSREEVGYDEESFVDKAKRGAGIFTLIGSGALSVLHILSHIVPAAGLLGFHWAKNTLYFMVLSQMNTFNGLTSPSWV